MLLRPTNMNVKENNWGGLGEGEQRLLNCKVYQGNLYPMYLLNISKLWQQFVRSLLCRCRFLVILMQGGKIGLWDCGIQEGGLGGHS